jgi:cell division protein FtsB
MNYFLMLIIIGLCCGGYYGYTTFQQVHTDDVHKLADLQAKLDPLSAQSDKLTADNAQLKKSTEEEQTEIADLTQQVQAAQLALVQAKQAATQATPVTAAATATPATPPPSSNDLGNITTLDGKSYVKCTLLKVQAECIVVNHSAGITQMAYTVMPQDLQKRFGFDPKVAPTLPPDQVEALEAKCKAAGGM